MKLAILTLALFLFACSIPTQPLQPDLDLSIEQSPSGYINQPLPKSLDAWGMFDFYYQQGHELEFRFHLDWEERQLRFFTGSYVIYTIVAYKWIPNPDTTSQHSKSKYWMPMIVEEIWTAWLFPKDNVPYVAMCNYWGDVKPGERITIMWSVESRGIKNCEFRQAQIIGSVR